MTRALVLLLALCAVCVADARAQARPPAGARTGPPRLSTEDLNRRSVFARDSTEGMALDTSAERATPAPGLRGAAPGGAGLSVVARYRAAHERRTIERALARWGGVLRPVEPPPLPLLDPDMRAWQALNAYADLPIVVDSLPPLFTLGRVVYVPPAGRLAFRNRFRHTRWSYVGTSYRTPLDTARTWRLRAALEAAYGPPTQTLADLGADVRLGPGTTFMFEYWFVVNDSLPVLVTDPGGPTDRGVVVGVDGEQRLDATMLRDLLFGAIPGGPMQPYADYLYDPDARRWEVVGYDGVRLVRRTIDRPDFRTAGRPRLEQLAAPPAPERRPRR